MWLKVYGVTAYVLDSAKKWLDGEGEPTPEETDDEQGKAWSWGGMGHDLRQSMRFKRRLWLGICLFIFAIIVVVLIVVTKRHDQSLTPTVPVPTRPSSGNVGLGIRRWHWSPSMKV